MFVKPVKINIVLQKFFFALANITSASVRNLAVALAEGYSPAFVLNLNLIFSIICSCRLKEPDNFFFKKSKIKPSGNNRFCTSVLKEEQSASVQIPAAVPAEE